MILRDAKVLALLAFDDKVPKEVDRHLEEAYAFLRHVGVVHLSQESLLLMFFEHYRLDGGVSPAKPDSLHSGEAGGSPPSAKVKRKAG